MKVANELKSGMPGAQIARPEVLQRLVASSSEPSSCHGKLESSFQVNICLNDALKLDLSRVDVAMLIDALLQTEATLCTLDDHPGSFHVLEWMRTRQQLLINRLDAVMIKTAPSFTATAEGELHI